VNRVAVTTDRFDDVAGCFVEVGLEPVELPCIEVEPVSPDQLAETRDLTSRADVLIVTSPRVVSLLWPHGGMPDVDTAAVGPSTAAAVARAGGRVSLTGEAGLAGLADLALDRLDGRRVVVAHAAGSDPAGLSQLRANAPDLEERVVYRSVPMAPETVEIDAVAFASPSAVEGWVLARDLEDVVVGAIGATTADAIARHRAPDVIAATPSYPALAESIATFMEVKV